MKYGIFLNFEERLLMKINKIFKDFFILLDILSYIII